MIAATRSVGCSELTARFAVEPARLRHLLPEGFTLAPVSVADPEGPAELIVRVLRADETTRPDGRLTVGGAQAWVLAAVEPPPGLELAGGDSHAIELYSFRDGAVSFRSRPDSEGGQRFRGCAIHLPVMLTIDGFTPGGGALPVPAITMRSFATGAGELREIADAASTPASESRPGPVRLRVDGLTTLPAVLDGTALYASGFDRIITLARMPGPVLPAGGPAQASASARSALPQPNLS